MGHAVGSLFDLEGLKKIGGIVAGDMLAVDPDLYAKFEKYQTKTVKDDATTRNVVFLTGLSAYTPEPINLFLRGESSIGKTYVTVNVLNLFPREDVWFLGGLSPTALVHDRGDLVDKNGDLILPVDKPGKDSSAEEKEAYRTYREKVKGAHYLVDVANKIFVFLEAPHLETFNKLRPILSHDCPEISFKFADRVGKGSPLQTLHVVIRGWPACVFCSTSEKFVMDLATRSFTTTPSNDPSKILHANQLTGAKGAFPWEHAQNKDTLLFAGYLRFFKDKMRELNAALPCAENFADAFPSKFPRSMRDFKHLLGLVQTRALFHFAQRPLLVRKLRQDVRREESDLPKYKETEETYVLAIKQDYDAVLTLWREIRETTETSAGADIMAFFNEVVQKKMVGKLDQVMTVKELTDSWNDTFSRRKSSDTIRNWVDFLCQIGYMTKEPNPTDKRENFLRVIKAEEESGDCTQNELSAFFTLENFKAWLNTAQQITEESRISLRRNILTNTETTPEAIFYSEILDSSVIHQSETRDAFAKTSPEKTENGKLGQYPNLEGLPT